MGSFVSTTMPVALLEGLAASPLGSLAVPAVLLLLTFSLVALSVPGALTPLSFTGGLLLGMSGIVVVALGALAGSYILFLASRRWLGEYMRRRFGARLDGMEDHFTKKGAAYVVGLRLGGVPHLLVTAGCAATPITARTFAAASLLGMLPAICLAALAGSAV